MSRCRLMAGRKNKIEGVSGCRLMERFHEGLNRKSVPLPLDGAFKTGRGRTEGCMGKGRPFSIKKSLQEAFCKTRLFKLFFAKSASNSAPRVRFAKRARAAGFSHPPSIVPLFRPLSTGPSPFPQTPHGGCFAPLFTNHGSRSNGERSFP